MCCWCISPSVREGSVGILAEPSLTVGLVPCLGMSNLTKEEGEQCAPPSTGLILLLIGNL